MVGITEFQVQTIVGASNPNWSLWSAKLASWKASSGIKGVSVNRPLTLGDSFTQAMIRECYNNQLIFWQRGMDDGPSGVSTFLDSTGYAGLVSQYGTTRARMHGANYLKASAHSGYLTWQKSQVAGFWSLAQQFGDCVWFSVGNEPENWYQHIFRGNRTPPFSGGAETGTLDGSTYGGFMQITDEGQVSPVPATARATFETAYGHSAPTDANIRTNIAASNAQILAAYGGNKYSGANLHGYWDDTGGTYYFGATGDDLGSRVYSEYGVDMTMSNASPLTVLAKPHSSAEVLVYWPEGTDGVLNILDNASYAAVVLAKATALAA